MWGFSDVSMAGGVGVGAVGVVEQYMVVLGCLLWVYVGWEVGVDEAVEGVAFVWLYSVFGELF